MAPRYWPKSEELTDVFLFTAEQYFRFNELIDQEAFVFYHFASTFVLCCLT